MSITNSFSISSDSAAPSSKPDLIDLEKISPNLENFGSQNPSTLATVIFLKYFELTQ